MKSLHRPKSPLPRYQRHSHSHRRQCHHVGCWSAIVLPGHNAGSVCFVCSQGSSQGSSQGASHSCTALLCCTAVLGWGEISCLPQAALHSNEYLLQLCSGPTDIGVPASDQLLLKSAAARWAGRRQAWTAIRPLGVHNFGLRPIAVPHARFGYEVVPAASCCAYSGQQCRRAALQMPCICYRSA